MTEGEAPPPHKLLDERPVGRFVGGAVAAVKVLLAYLPLVVVSQARANHVAVGDLSLEAGKKDDNLDLVPAEGGWVGFGLVWCASKPR